MVTTKKAAGKKTTGKLKLKKTTIKNLDAKKTVKGGAAMGVGRRLR